MTQLLPIWLRWAENHEETQHAHANLPHGDWCRLPVRLCTLLVMAESLWAWLMSPFWWLLPSWRQGHAEWKAGR